MTKIDKKTLQRKWLHAQEEDTADEAVFRPDTHPLPPARGRTGYSFEAGGRVKKIGPGPTDRSSSAEGTWSVDAKGRLTIRIPGQPDEVLETSSLEPDRFVVKKKT